MANKQDFTPEEWTKILQSPMLVGIAVSMADPSVLWGALKEAAAGSAEIGTAKRDASANELIKAVITDINTPDGRSALQNAPQKLLCRCGTGSVRRALARQFA